jgi:DNA-binding response OmpR family regulator
MVAELQPVAPALAGPALQRWLAAVPRAQRGHTWVWLDLLLRRVATLEAERDALQARLHRRTVDLGAEVIVHLDAGTVRGPAGEIPLTDYQWQALRVLAEAPGTVIAQGVLRAALGLPAGEQGRRALRQLLLRVRGKRGPAGGALQTLRERGYRLQPVSAEAEER